METGRGKKGKKAWHLNLGLMDVIIVGIGVVGLMSLSFALGTLAGRGDIYRAAYSWGLLTPEPKAASQVMPQAAVPPALATAEAPASPTTTAPVAAVPAAAPAPPALASLPGGPAAPKAAKASTPAARAAHPAPIAGSMAPLPPPATTASSKKKAKAAQAQQEQKAREDQLHRQRQAVASKLTFQNSLDSSPKPGQKKDKTAAKPQPTQVKVGTFRDSKAAQVKLAELQKQGVKATLKQGKDAKGAFYTLYRQTPAAHPKEGDNLAQKKEKASGAGASQKPQSH
ncbi:MAG: hypothetical protein NTW80_08765 [Deltaproteobacteria bacterium]|nr:hypothetical protein [Deltaproteobacteria bacterium]